MGATGYAIVDFGTGNSDTTAVITGQSGILLTSFVEAWLAPVIPTTDHSIDEHIAEHPYIDAGKIVPGVGFTIYAVTNNVALRGQWKVAWVWQ